MFARDSLSHRAAKYFDCFRTALSDGSHFMFGSYMTLIFWNWVIAFILLCIVEKETISFSDVAFVTATPSQLCVNVTCGAFYCSMRLPSDCEAETHRYSLLRGETQTLCYHACQWSVEVLASAKWDNRTVGLYIQPEMGLPIKFPVLEGGKLIDVGITKYADRRFSPPQDSWRIESMAGGASTYSGCGSTLNQELKQDRRCGAYRLFMDVDEVAKDPMPSLLLKLMVRFLIFVFIVMVYFSLQLLVNWSAFMHSIHLHNYGPKDE
jgi:hypothetical protein